MAATLTRTYLSFGEPDRSRTAGDYANIEKRVETLAEISIASRLAFTVATGLALQS